MTISVVQHTSYFANNGTNHGAVTLTGVAAGNCLIAVVGTGVSNTDVPTISDTVNGSWPAKLVSSSLPVDHDNYLVYNFPNTGAGSPVITVTNGAASTVQFHVMEVSGLATTNPFDTSATGYNASASSITTSSMTPAQNNELIIGVMGTDSNQPTPTAAGSATRIESTQNLATSTLIITGGGAQTAGWTLINGTSEVTAIVAGFKAASSPDVTVSITGSSIGTAQGNVTQTGGATNVFPAGISATVSAGTVTVLGTGGVAQTFIRVPGPGLAGPFNNQQFIPSPRGIPFALSASSSLTGSVAASAAGTLLATTTVFITGQGVATAQGNIFFGNGPTPTGIALTASAGTTTINLSVRLQGQTAIVIQGLQTNVGTGYFPRGLGLSLLRI